MKDRIKKFYKEHPQEFLLGIIISSTAAASALITYQVARGQGVIGGGPVFDDKAKIIAFDVRLRNGKTIHFTPPKQ